MSGASKLLQQLGRAGVILLVAALIAGGVYAVAQSPFATPLTQILNVPRDENLGLLAGPLNALPLPAEWSASLAFVGATIRRTFGTTLRGRQGFTLALGLLDVGKSVLVLAVMIALVSVIQRLTRARR